jgi:activator of HSP90 ATPase
MTRSKSQVSTGKTTRRQLMASSSLAIAGLAITASGAQQPMAEIPGTAEDSKKTALHQEIELKVPAARVYQILIDSKQFAAFTGAPAEIHPEAGGTFSLFGGMIGGRNIELVTGVRIVQAWRPPDWPAGVYSLVRFEFKDHGPNTTLVLDHSSFPAGGFTHLNQGWRERYWGPLSKYLA